VCQQLPWQLPSGAEMTPLELCSPESFTRGQQPACYCHSLQVTASVTMAAAHITDMSLQLDILIKGFA